VFKGKNNFPIILPAALLGAVITVIAAILLTVLIICAASTDPGETLQAFFLGPWESPWFFGNTLDSVGLLLTASLGITLAFRGGCFNLGGEGQIYLGGLAAAAVLLAGKNMSGGAFAPILSCLAALAAMTAGGVMSAISGILKKYFGANELITSFLLSAALSPVADYFISGPMRNPAENLLATPRFASGLLLPKLLPPSNLSVSFPLALALIFLGHIFLYRTIWGYRFRISGSVPAFARYGGINPDSCIIPSMAASGVLSGLTGFFAVAGTYGLCHQGFSGGLGWNAVAVSLIARNRPLALLPAALIYGWLKAGSESALLARGLNFETSAFIQAVVLIMATIHFSAPILRRKFREGKTT
jgi:simple sugar transport system permease protein